LPAGAFRPRRRGSATIICRAIRRSHDAIHNAARNQPPFGKRMDARLALGDTVLLSSARIPIASLSALSFAQKWTHGRAAGCVQNSLLVACTIIQSEALWASGSKTSRSRSAAGKLAAGACHPDPRGASVRLGIPGVAEAHFRASVSPQARPSASLWRNSGDLWVVTSGGRAIVPIIASTALGPGTTVLLHVRRGTGVTLSPLSLLAVRTASGTPFRSLPSYYGPVAE
jgi:hypothetical protein